MFRRNKNTKQKFSIRKYSLGAASILVGSLFLTTPTVVANGSLSYEDRLRAVSEDPTLSVEEKSRLWSQIMQEKSDEIANSVKKGIEESKKKAEEEGKKIRDSINKSIAEAKDTTKDGTYTIIDNTGIRQEVRKDGIVTVYRLNTQGVWVKVNESTYIPKVTTTTQTVGVTTQSQTTVPTTSVPTTTQTSKVEEATTTASTAQTQTAVPTTSVSETTQSAPTTQVATTVAVETAKALKDLTNEKPELDINLFTTTSSQTETTSAVSTTEAPKVEATTQSEVSTTQVAPSTSKQELDLIPVTTTEVNKGEQTTKTSQVLVGQNSKPELTLTSNTSTSKKELSVVETAKVVSNTVAKESVKEVIKKKVNEGRVLPKTTATTVGLGALTLGLGATLLAAGLLVARRKQSK